MKKIERKMKISFSYDDDLKLWELIGMLIPYIKYCHIYNQKGCKKAIIGLKTDAFNADMVTQNDENDSKSGNSCNDSPVKGEVL